MLVTPEQTAIYAIDFKNFTYPDICGDKGDYVRLVNGSSDRVERSTTLDEVSYGWLQNEPQNVAAILVTCSGGGTGEFSGAFLYAVNHGHASLKTIVCCGDRADGGIASVNLAWGRLIIQTYSIGPQGVACCPTSIVTTVYRWDGKKLVKVNETSQPFGLP